MGGARRAHGGPVQRVDGHRPIRIATRGSALALAQARSVADALPAPAELVRLVTRGDRARGPLAEIGGKGLFTAELEAALRRGEVQLAVHSAKDVPVEMAEDMAIAAVPRRADPRDALVSPQGASLAELPPGAGVGTSSLRRAVQVRAARADLTVVAIRGNVHTRLRKLREGRCAAVVLALAGLHRLGLTDRLAGRLLPLDVEAFVPAAGQGALAVQCLSGERRTRELLQAIDDPDSSASLHAERRVVRRLGASCRSAVGVHVSRRARRWRAVGMVGDAERLRLVRASVEGDSPEAAAEALLARLAADGAAALLGGSGGRT